MNIIAIRSDQPWNKGKLVGQKAPLRLKDIWAIRVRLQIAERTRDLALFDLAIDSKNQASRSRRRPWRACINKSHGDAAEGAAARTIRDHRTNTVCYRGPDSTSTTPQRGSPFSEPAACLRPSSMRGKGIVN